MPKFYRSIAEKIKQNHLYKPEKEVPREVIITGSGPGDDNSIEPEIKFKRQIKPLKFNF